MHRIEPKQSPHMKARARQLRRDAPIPERILWGLLRAGRLNSLKFRRQQPLGPYVADFFCEAARLAVELDGRSHGGQERADDIRDNYFRSRGIEVLRVTNDELLRHRVHVAERIYEVAESRVKKPSPQPSPTGRGAAPSPQPSPTGRGAAPSPQPSPERRGE